MADLLIYQDYVHNSGNLLNALVSRYGRNRVAYADADAIIKGELTSDVKALFMPGGATRYVAAKLNGAGNKAIDKYVSEGGVYFGICAGAYYACRRTEWAIGTEDEMQIDNELPFFQGVARGPVNAFLNAAERCTAITKMDNHAVLYWEGPEFIADDKASHEVLARYTDLPGQSAAIVTGQHGKGRYILSSPHIEITSERLKLMQFDVAYNRFVELTPIRDISGLTTALFDALLDKYLG